MGAALERSTVSLRKCPPPIGPVRHTGQIPIGPVYTIPGSQPNPVPKFTGLQTEFLTVLESSGLLLDGQRVIAVSAPLPFSAT